MNIVCNTPVQILYKYSTYQDGDTVTNWRQYYVEDRKVFFCEWRNFFGSPLIEANAKGVAQPARVRMPYDPTLYRLLQSRECVIVRSAENIDLIHNVPAFDSLETYSLYSNVDNINDEYMWMEYNVKRYERR